MKGYLPSTGNSAQAAPIVFIRGATGYYAYLINGLFEPTEEKSSDGRVVYKKRGNASRIIEHFTGDWQIKPVSNKGKGGFWAFVKGGCALEACADGVWQVAESGVAHAQVTVKMSSGAEAEAQASSLDARALQHNPPPPLPRPSPAPPSALYRP